MGMTAYVPSNLEEFHERMQQLYENRSHVKTVKVDTANRQIKVDLDWAANLKVPDFYIPVKASRVVEAREVTARLWNNMQAQIAPGKNDTEALYNLIDTAHR